MGLRAIKRDKVIEVDFKNVLIYVGFTKTELDNIKQKITMAIARIKQDIKKKKKANDPIAINLENVRKEFQKDYVTLNNMKGY